MESEIEAVARGAIEAINDRTLRARAQELLDPSMVRHDLVQLFPDSQGASGGFDFVGLVLAAMPDFRLDIEDIFGAGDRVAVRLRMEGTHTGQPLLGRPATGAKFSAGGVFIYRIQGGRVAEAWQMLDGLAFFRLAGLLS
ncbi:MAG TPA: ester cyclase [Acidimicrobiales bacterium]|nr:ester cyclase [Acidimicrobiales bacterium]